MRRQAMMLSTVLLASLPLSRAARSDAAFPDASRRDFARASDSVEAEHLRSWQKLVFEAVASNRYDPPMASWLYAVHATVIERILERRERAAALHLPSAFSGAALVIFRDVFPLEVPRMEALASRDDAASFRSGEETARELLRERENDGSQTFSLGSPPQGKPGLWHSLQRPVEIPLRPAWGSVRTWYGGDVSKIPVPPPPEFGSAAFLEGLRAVREVSDQRTEDDLVLVHKWAFGDGTMTPAGFWVRFTADLAREAGWDLARTARATGLVARTVMDAGIAAWHVKYQHWLLRPSEADPLIIPATFVRVPNFPAYVSGHSAYSAAAAVALSHLFPSRAAEFDAMAKEASVSRVLAGFHYPFDCDEGLALGRRVGEASVAANRADPS